MMMDGSDKALHTGDAQSPKRISMCDSSRIIYRCKQDEKSVRSCVDVEINGWASVCGSERTMDSWTRLRFGATVRHQQKCETAAPELQLA
jgi:hypothetical protein